jgi:hypothetical protein
MDDQGPLAHNPGRGHVGLRAAEAGLVPCQYANAYEALLGGALARCGEAGHLKRALPGKGHLARTNNLLPTGPAIDALISALEVAAQRGGSSG